MRFLRRLVACWRAARCAEVECLAGRGVVHLWHVERRPPDETLHAIGQAFPHLKGTPVIFLRPRESIEQLDDQQLRDAGLARVTQDTRRAIETILGAWDSNLLDFHYASSTGEQDEVARAVQALREGFER